MQRFIAPDREVKKGLAELARDFSKGDRSVYPLFYSQGATFWAEIDKAITEATGGKQTLGDLLPILFQSKYDDASAFPPKVLASLRETLGDRLAPILDKYVGR